MLQFLKFTLKNSNPLSTLIHLQLPLLSGIDFDFVRFFFSGTYCHVCKYHALACHLLSFKLSEIIY